MKFSNKLNFYRLLNLSQSFLTSHLGIKISIHNMYELGLQYNLSAKDTVFIKNIGR